MAENKVAKKRSVSYKQSRENSLVKWAKLQSRKRVRVSRENSKAAELERSKEREEESSKKEFVVKAVKES